MKLLLNISGKALRKTYRDLLNPHATGTDKMMMFTLLWITTKIVPHYPIRLVHTADNSTLKQPIKNPVHGSQIHLVTQ
jgi:hypothetical protein